MSKSLVVEVNKPLKNEQLNNLLEEIRLQRDMSIIMFPHHYNVYIVSDAGQSSQTFKEVIVKYVYEA